MKKRTIPFIILFSIDIFGYGQTCDRFFETALTYENDFLGLHYENFPTGNYYKIYHRTTPGESVNTSLNAIDIKKPIIIIEGYDIFNELSCKEIYYNYINYNYFADRLRADGYDIITYNLSTPMAALQPNALVFADFIQFINENKTGDEELIIMGVSMGGLITRYALTYMEENNMQHQTKLFISFDSPQKGGYAPLSMQALIADNNIKLAAFFSLFAGGTELYWLQRSFISDGTLQMLTHSIYNVSEGYALPAEEYTRFFNELTSMNSCGGYPMNCKRVAISNGSLNGELQQGNSLIGDFSGNPAVLFDVELLDLGGLGDIRFSRMLYSAAGVDNYWGDSEGQCIYQATQMCDLGTEYYFIKGDQTPADHVPGGHYPWYKVLVDELASVDGVNIYMHLMDNACFVSTNSALDLNTDDDLMRVSDYTKEEILSDTHFDDIWWNTSHSNMPHTSYDRSIINFIEDQIYLSEKEGFAKDEIINISGGETNSGEKDLSKTSNAITIDNHKVNNGGQLTVKSGKSIRIGQGFRVEAGGTFSATVEDIKSRNCKLAGNLPQFDPDNYPWGFQLKSYTSSKVDTSINGMNISLHSPNNGHIENNTTVKPVSINNNIINHDEISVFPNPSTNIINIYYSINQAQNISIKIIESVTGRTVRSLYVGISKSGVNNIQSDISELSGGLYLIVLQTEKSIVKEKFIKL